MPYDKIIDEMRKYVNTCNPKTAQSLFWFLKQANGEYGPGQAITIPEKDMKEIKGLADKFMHDCECKDKYIYVGLSPEIVAMHEHATQRTHKITKKLK